MKQIALLLSLFLLTACSTTVLNPWDDPIAKNLTGKSVAFVKTRLGLPNRRAESSSGAMVWTYIDRDKNLSTNECRVSLAIRNDVVEKVSITTKSQSLATLMTSFCSNIRKNLG